MSAIHAERVPPLLHRRREFLEDLLRILPVDAGISDTHAILEPLFAFLRNFLVAWNSVSLLPRSYAG